MKINLDYIMLFDPCNNVVNEYIEAGHEDFNGTVLEFLNLNGISVSNKLWVILRKEIIPENDLHEIACKFAERILVIFEIEYPNDDRPRKAIEAKRKYLKGEITKEELCTACDAAWVAAWAAWAAESYAAWAAESYAAWAAWAAESYAAWAAESYAARAAESDAASDAAWVAARIAAWDAARIASATTEKQKQLDIVIDYFKIKNRNVDTLKQLEGEK